MNWSIRINFIIWNAAPSPRAFSSFDEKKTRFAKQLAHTSEPSFSWAKCTHAITFAMPCILCGEIQTTNSCRRATSRRKNKIRSSDRLKSGFLLVFRDHCRRQNENKTWRKHDQWLQSTQMAHEKKYCWFSSSQSLRRRLSIPDRQTAFGEFFPPSSALNWNCNLNSEFAVCIEWKTELCIASVITVLNRAHNRHTNWNRVRIGSIDCSCSR